MRKAAATAENVRVLVRCRPLSEKEKGNGHKNCVEMDMAHNSIAVRSLCGEPDRWTFDAVINNTYAQKNIFTQFIMPLVDSVLEGFNATVFAYGQSGSGKTYTMTGVMGNAELEGVIPRCFTYIFESIKATRESNPNKSFSMYVSFVELYNGKVRDLLAKKQVTLDVRENKDHTFFVQGAHIPQVKFPEEIIHHMEEGTERRRTASTELNADSSRSHSLFTLVLECTETLEDGTVTSVTSKLNLVDLAGSERQNKTGASGDTLKEGCNINLSLSALGTVIDCIVKNAPHVPFRSSPLTMLLKDSLGGNSKTVMFANINPSERNVSETVSTLRFADRAKQIKNKPVVNMDSKDQKIAELTQMLSEAREKLKKYETDGTQSLEKELEDLRERVGELEVNLDSAVKGREADTVDYQNEKTRLAAEHASAAAQQSELEEQLSQLRNDLQIAEAGVADEKSQREELMQLCATYLSGGGSSSSGTSSGAPAACESVQDVAALLRERFGEAGKGGGDGSGSSGGGASAKELAELRAQLEALTVENNSLKRNLTATEKEMSAKLKESKESAKKAEAKLKKLSKELADAKAAKAAAAAAAAATATATATVTATTETTTTTTTASAEKPPSQDPAAMQAAIAEVQKLIDNSPVLRSLSAALTAVSQRQEELSGGVQKELLAAKAQLAKPANGASDVVRQYSALLHEDVHQTESRGKVMLALCQVITSLRQAWRQALAVPMAVASGNLDAAKQAVAAMEAVDAQTAEGHAQLLSKLVADVAKAYHQRNTLVELIAAAHSEAAGIDLKKEVRKVLDENEELRQQCEVLTTEKDALDTRVRDGQRYAAMRAQLAGAAVDTSATGTTTATSSTGNNNLGAGAGKGNETALAMLDTLRAELDEAKNHYDAMEKARDILYDELKAQRKESAATEQTVAALQCKLREAESKLTVARGSEEEITRLEARMRERADQLMQLRGLLDKQKDLIVKSNEKAEYLQDRLRTVQTESTEREARFREVLEERDASTQRIINERVSAYVESRQGELGAKDHTAKKLKKKLKKLEEAMLKREVEFDQMVCECEDLRTSLEEQKVIQLRLMRQLEEGGCLNLGVGTSIMTELAAIAHVDDERDNYQNAVERAREARKKKADLFDLGEVQSVRSHARSRGSNVTDDGDASSGGGGFCS